MAKRLKTDGNTPAGQGKTKPLTNGFDAEQVQGFADRIHALLDEMESANGATKKKVQDVYNEAREIGVKTSILRGEIAEQRHDRKKEAKLARMDTEDRDHRDLIRKALGTFRDTELGQAAIEREARPN